MLKNKKAQLSKTGIVLVISAFYIFLGIGLGLYGETFEPVVIEDRSIIDVNNETDAAGGFFSKLANIKLFAFFGNMITGIQELPPILNTIIFSPLIVMIIYLIITSLPTFNGGG